MPEMRTYTGGCHCGQVRYEATTDLGRVVSCNCSICSKRGLLLAFIGRPQFKPLSGQGEQTEYQFGRKRIHHLFCPACGVESYATGSAPDGSEMVAVNVRCLDSVDVNALTLTPFDGRSL